MPRAGWLVWPATIALAVVAEASAFGWDAPNRWIPDVAVGLAFVAAGMAPAADGPRGARVLLVACGWSWFAGNLSGELLYLHRGVLAHLILAYPAARPRPPAFALPIAAAYVAALIPELWSSEVATVAFAALLVAGAWWRHRVAVGRDRHFRRFALRAAAVLAAGLAGGALARTMGGPEAVEGALLGYELALAASALILAVGLGAGQGAAVTDLVVELAHAPSGTLAERLAAALGDRTLEVGYWAPDARAYVDAAGRRLAVPPPGSPRAATPVDRDGAPFVVLLHDQATLRDPVVAEAVAIATRLSGAHGDLQAEVQARAREIAAAHRRHLVAADAERQGLEARLRAGPERRLARAADALETLPVPGPAAQRARAELLHTVEELRELGHGLHPRELTERGLDGALEALAGRAPLPVAVDARAGALPSEIATAAYFICAEALANVAKHSRAAGASIAATVDGGVLRLAVLDDGAGGADAALGTGLQGLADRAAALGGSLAVRSPAGGGTRLVAELPLTDEARPIR